MLCAQNASDVRNHLEIKYMDLGVCQGLQLIMIFQIVF